MPTRITQIGCQADVKRKLKVEGNLTLADAELLESLCNELCEQSDSCISVDLAGITFLDSESASVLCRLKEQGIALEGLDLFVRKVVELAEKPAAPCR
jgi:anti-anti-sigma regulatory factor